ncbi:substrate-binding domain-containing protein [Chelativorans sp. M5D2P16]|uniref:substrate-binding domain-containing protein n=1 Tax=Chelativorans sp. M5D2P16 TaxID=3095678 RepID=UPI002ACACB2E|nr:substrate-binding domain-containing protein [Chelativorans sp. M5D2P16]MDZ5695828.1 substrate-binding domain-containing protein [Chelativorans sp. M5D2P16]
MTVSDRRLSRIAVTLCLPVLATAVALGATASRAAGPNAAWELVDPDHLRVCADPSNMPFTDESEEGFENKLAELVAEKLGRESVRYEWFPMATGFVRNTLRSNRCDVIMGYAQGDELVQNTNAYYRSAYVLIYKKGDGLDGVETIEDGKLADKRIGIVQGTPPSSNIAAAGLMKNAKVYPLMVDTRFAPSVAETMVADLVEGKIDAAAVWGPMAGYYVKQADADLVMVPLVKEQTGSRMTYRITMGVRPSDQEWKRTLNRFIRDNQDEINRILLEYNVPLLDEQNQAITQ